MWLCVHAPMYSTLPKKEKERKNDFFFLDQIQLKKALVKLFIGSDQDGHQVIKSRSRWFGHVKRRDRG